MDNVILPLLGLFVVLCVIIFARYLALTGLYHTFVYKTIQTRRPKRIISDRFDKQQIWQEVYWSGISTLIFAAFGILLLKGFESGHTQIYTDVADFPLWYVPISLFVAMFLHETYYYWLHRWLHKPGIYRFVHKVHHDSIHTSAWTSFSFHPLESLLQAVIVPIIVWFLPMHWIVVFLFLFLMTISAIINHAGVEIYPAKWLKHPIMKWLIGSTHHDVHHRRFNFNFGLYFTFWDKWMNTENTDFADLFESVTDQKNQTI